MTSLFYYETEILCFKIYFTIFHAKWLSLHFLQRPIFHATSIPPPPPDLEAYDFHAKQLPPYFPLCQRAFDFPYEASSIDFYK